MVKSSCDYDSSADEPDKQLEALAEKFDQESSVLENESQKKNKFSKDAQESLEKLKEKHAEQQEKKKLEEGVKIGKEVIAKMKEEKAKASQAKPTSTPVRYQQTEQKSAFEDRNRVLKEIKKDLSQHKQNNASQQQYNYPRNDSYNSGNYYNSAPKSTKQRPPVSDYERDMARSGFKSKNVRENEKIDEEEKKLAQKQAAEFKPYVPLTPEEIAYREEKARLKKLEQKIREQENEARNFMHRRYNTISKLRNSIHSEKYREILNKIWSDEIYKANKKLDRDHRKSMLEVYDQYLGHVNGSPVRGWIEKIEIAPLDSNLDTANLNDLRYYEAFRQFSYQANMLSVEYEKWEESEFLPQLRNQPDKVDLRRELEFKHLNEQDRINLQNLKKQLKEHYDEQYKQLPFCVGFWEKTVGPFTSEKSSRQILEEEHKKKKQKALDNFIDDVSDRYKKIQEEKERAEKEIQKAKEDLDREKENTDNDSSPFLTNTDTIIKRNSWDRFFENNNYDSVDFIVTPKKNEFLQQGGISPDEFNNFKGETSEQDEFHATLSRAIDNANVIEGKVPAHVREMYQEIAKVSYELNKANYVELAQELLEILNPVTLTLALGKEITNTLLHPIEYIQRRLKEINPEVSLEDVLYIEKCKKNKRIIEDIVRTTKELSIKDTAPSALVRIENDYKIRKLLTQERQKMLAKSSIDFLIDYLLIAATDKTIKIAGIDKALNNYRLRNRHKRKYPHYDITVKAHDNPRSSSSSSAVASETGLPALIENAAKQENAVVAQNPVTIRKITNNERLIKVVSEPIASIKDKKTIIYQVRVDAEFNTITEFNIRLNEYVHIFSDKHKKKGGILKLGANEIDILNKVADLIVESDKAGLIKNGQTNQIETIINGHDVCIRVHVQDNKVLSFDAYRIFEPMKRQSFNSFKFSLEKYK